ncbi:hypothetical protein Poly21_31270 [Allorhodopirellula heiligendammensis]|uniref:Uncharacterized protein n=1 Tax=Allorhodopirellula heiligendammensis TaxID=2714739 RepID=A0A5C6BUI0_9BACT|nr:hypothetical protein Poly21_31270 [Allorhodopirellula heiligendammensis]
MPIPSYIVWEDGDAFSVAGSLDELIKLFGEIGKVV